MLAEDTINELRKRFNADAARGVSATYRITIRGDGGGSWLVKIQNGGCDFTKENGTTSGAADCTISVESSDLEMIMAGKMSAMTAALSGLLSIDGELGLAMQLMPIFFEGQTPTF
jgi:putative sterol carrier protein